MRWPEAIYGSVCVIGMVAFVLFILCNDRRAKR